MQAILKSNESHYRFLGRDISKEDISTFINEAPDDISLLMKVATIFGLAGACRREELSKIFTADIEDKGNLIKVCSVKAPNATSTIFVNYKNGKCTKQCVGDKQFREDALRNCGIF
ncbi:hypothetical protein NQ317_002213 [Molorchus minor]|uniref:Tyr recombinase domain-containing protein n=1 Tax=Molorchus minor TaxID=1323400 RepID=A0ABQ9JQQ7_9CUCU|nr:hypothetical protein NQ317_002213 [Molorchus minor]